VPSRHVAEQSLRKAWFVNVFEIFPNVCGMFVTCDEKSLSKKNLFSVSTMDLQLGIRFHTFSTSEKD